MPEGSPIRPSRRQRGRVGFRIAVTLAVGLAAAFAVAERGSTPAGAQVPLPAPLPVVPNVGAVELGGIPNTRIFNPATNRWRQVGNMHFSRWYPSAVILRDGKVFVASGVRKSQHTDAPTLSQIRRTETYHPRTGTWTENFTGPRSENSLPLYARLYLAPNGKIFYSGSGQAWAPGGGAIDEVTWGIQQFFNLRTKQWEPAGVTRTATVRSVPLEVMLSMKPPYDKATILQAGGTPGPSPDLYLAVNLSDTYTVDTRGRVMRTATGNMNHRRWGSQGVVLPTGEVVAFSGADREESFAPGTERPVRQAEIYNPRTRTWRVAAVAARDRTYHNTAVLLPDARVLVGGHAPAPDLLGYVHDFADPGAANNERDASWEVYSPPYLFRGRRPAIARVQRGIAWGRTFRVVTPDAASISKVVLSRLPAQTHTFDNNQRTIELAFERGAPLPRPSRLTGGVTAETSSNVLRVKAPPSGTVAPPGPYYLFIIRKSRLGPIPSVAAVVTVNRMADFRAAVQPRARTARVPSGSATPDLDTRLALPGECPSCREGAFPARPASPRPAVSLRRLRVTGAFSAPFEEGGGAEPLCRRRSDGYIICKPAAQTQIVLPDGRILYWDGFPGTENSRLFANDGGDMTHNAEARLLDIRTGTPRWSTPHPVDGGAVNPEIAAGTVPNDRADNNRGLPNDGDLFCSNQVHLANGQVLVMGGTDWYTDPLAPISLPVG